MLARVQSYLLQGIDALPCEVEVNFDEREGTDSGGPIAVTVGLPDAGVRESHERVRSAVCNSGYHYGNGKTLVNLAPADVRKEGPLYDLPIAIGLLISQGVIRLPGGRTPVGAARPARPGLNTTPESPFEALDYRKLLFGGELALDGRLRPIKGAIALAALAKAKGAQGVIVPAANATEASVVQGVEVFGAHTLAEVVGMLTGELESQPVPAPDVHTLLHNAAAPIDFSEVRGQESVKRAIVIAAAGGHNLLGLWPSSRHGRRSQRRTVGHNILGLWTSDRHGARVGRSLNGGLGRRALDPRRPGASTLSSSGAKQKSLLPHQHSTLTWRRGRPGTSCGCRGMLAPAP
jgi:magnesium chelatase family protein